MADDEAKLTDKQRVFVEHYLQCWNASEAARRAGYSDKTAPFIGAENLKKPQISDAIQKRISEVAMSADEVLLRLARHARGNFAPFLYQGDMLKGEAPKLDLSTDEARNNIDLVKKVKTKTITKITSQSSSNGSEADEPGAESSSAVEIVEVELELYDAQAALVHLGRHHKLFTDKTEVNGTVNTRDVTDLTEDELDSLIAAESAKH